MNLLLAALVSVTLHYAGEIQWAGEPTKVCLYKMPGDPPRFYWTRVAAMEECPATQEVQVDDSTLGAKTSVASN